MKAAPHHFPYHHRTLAGHTDAEMLDRYEYCQRRFNAGLVNWREPDKRVLRLQKPVEIIHTIECGGATCGATNAGDSCKEKAGREGVCTASPGPDHTSERSARNGYTAT